jgi:hypothetical protein
MTEMTETTKTTETTKQTTFTAKEVLITLQKYLADVWVDDKTLDALPIRFHVVENSLHKSEFAWRVRLSPSREPRRWTYVYEELALLEEKIAEEAGVNLFITTSDSAVAVV